MAIAHGGTDSGPAPRIDLSTNANPYGPSPVAQAAMATPIAAYPDPAYTRTREAIAAYTGVPVDEIVVGAGATELIYRLVFCAVGSVAAPVPGFGEYAGAAALYERHFHPLPAHPDDRVYALPVGGVAFITNPGSPDGRVRSLAWIAEIQAHADTIGTWLVWDLAYHQLCAPTDASPRSTIRPGDYPASAILLFAPNKAHGCTGLRAGWLRAPAPIAAQLRAAQQSWIVSAPAAAFLEGQASRGADEWVATSNLRMHATASQLADALTRLGWAVTKGDTPWLVVKELAPGLAGFLRADFGIKVRDLESQGLPGYWRIGTPHHRDLDEVIAAFTALSERTGLGEGWANPLG